MALSDTITRNLTNVAFQTRGFGTSGTYTPEGGTGKTITGIVGPWMQTDAEGNVDTIGITKELTISAKDNTTGHVFPKYRLDGSGGDTWTMTFRGVSTVFSVVSPISSDGYSHRMLISTAPDFLGGGH